MRKHLVLWTAVLTLWLVTAAPCLAAGSADKAADPHESLAPVPKPAGSDGFPVTVTDVLNRTVTIDNALKRVVSLSPSNTEILYAVGAGELVVGVTTYCTYPPEAAAVEKIGGFSVKTISVEAILGLEPDLVLSAGDIHQTVIEALEQAGITVVAVAGNSFEAVNGDILLTGMLTGHAAEAETLVAGINQRLERIRTAVSTVQPDERPRVFWELFDDPLMTAGPSSFTGQAIVLAGGINIFGDLAGRYPKISQEELLLRNPDVILGPDSHGDRLTPEAIAARVGWSRIKAVQDGRIHLIQGDIASRGGPRLIDAVEAMAHALHPQLFR